MNLLGEEKDNLCEHEQPNIKNVKNSKSFIRVTRVGLIPYILIIALIVTFYLSNVQDEVTNITDIIFILSPLLFTKFLKDLYDYLVAKERFNEDSKSRKEIELEEKSIISLLSAMATFPVVLYLIVEVFTHFDITCFLLSIVLLVLIASFIIYIVYYVFIYDIYSTDESKKK